MTKDEFDRAKEAINRRPLNDFYRLTPSGAGMYNCPICESGTRQKHTGALKVYNNGGEYRVICYSHGCFGNSKGKTSSTLDALCKIWNMEATEVMQKAGYASTNTASRQAQPPKQEQQKKASYTPPAEKDFTEDYEKWHIALLQDKTAMTYLANRGIKEETAKKLKLGLANIGYGDKQSFKTPRIVIPYNEHYYKARRIDGKEEAKYIPSGGGKYLYNVSAFQDGEDDQRLTPIVVVEGEMNAIAIRQGGYERVIAIGAASNYEELAKQAKEKNQAAVYVLALDNDPEDEANPEKGKTGQKAQAKLAKQLEDAGIDYVEANTATLYGPCTDAADAILTDGLKFWETFWDVANQGYLLRQQREETAAQEAYYRSGPGMVDKFLEDVRGRTYEPLPCGIPEIDRVLGGGFTRKDVVIIGGSTGIGKTTFTSQLCENIARAGTADVLYFNLEMDRQQLLAKSLARELYLTGRKNISVMKILQGYRWTEDEEAAIMAAAEKYKASTAQHLIYNPGELTTNIDAIMAKIQEEKKRIGHAPGIVVIDYLQLLTGQVDGRTEDSAQTIKRALQRLKEFAMEDKSVVLVITANNRTSTQQNKSDLTSGRDTSNIEYGADLHLGLEYTRKNDKEGITLRVNKARLIPTAGQKVLLRFVGGCALFAEENRYSEDQGDYDDFDVL